MNIKKIGHLLNAFFSNYKNHAEYKHINGNIHYITEIQEYYMLF